MSEAPRSPKYADETCDVEWARPGHQPGLVGVARSLAPDLDEQRAARLQLDLQYQHALVARDPMGPIGFVSFFLAEGQAHIAWLMVPANPRGACIRRQLLNRMRRDLGRLGVRQVCAHQHQSWTR